MIAGNAHAHHSILARYDRDRTIEIKGVVVDYRLRAPHSFFVIDVPQEDGPAERWNIQADPLTTLRRSGLDPDTYQAGDEITVFAHPPRTLENREAYAKEFITPDGSRFGQRVNFVTVTPDALSENVLENMTGRWARTRHGVRVPDSLPLTREGREARENYDPKLTPANMCEPAPLPLLFFATSYLHDFHVQDDMVILFHEVSGVTRRVPLHSEPRSVEPTGGFGLAAGRTQGHELVIESSGFPPSAWGLAIAAIPPGNGADIPSSAQKKVIERYTVSEDGTILSLDFTVEDPVYLEEPYSGHFEFARLADDEPIIGEDCDPEAAALSAD